MKPLYISDETWKEIQEIGENGRCEVCGGKIKTWSYQNGKVTCQRHPRKQARYGGSGSIIPEPYKD